MSQGPRVSQASQPASQSVLMLSQSGLLRRAPRLIVRRPSSALVAPPGPARPRRLDDDNGQFLSRRFKEHKQLGPYILAPHGFLYATNKTVLQKQPEGKDAVILFSAMDVAFTGCGVVALLKTRFDDRLARTNALREFFTALVRDDATRYYFFSERAGNGVVPVFFDLDGELRAITPVCARARISLCTHRCVQGDAEGAVSAFLQYLCRVLQEFVGRRTSDGNPLRFILSATPIRAQAPAHAEEQGEQPTAERLFKFGAHIVLPGCHVSLQELRALRVLLVARWKVDHPYAAGGLPATAPRGCRFHTAPENVVDALPVRHGTLRVLGCHKLKKCAHSAENEHGRNCVAVVRRRQSTQSATAPMEHVQFDPERVYTVRDVLDAEGKSDAAALQRYTANRVSLLMDSSLNAVPPDDWEPGRLPVDLSDAALKAANSSFDPDPDPDADPGGLIAPETWVYLEVVGGIPREPAFVTKRTRGSNKRRKHSDDPLEQPTSICAAPMRMALTVLSGDMGPAQLCGYQAAPIPDGGGILYRATVAPLVAGAPLVCQIAHRVHSQNPEFTVMWSNKHPTVVRFYCAHWGNGVRGLPHAMPCRVASVPVFLSQPTLRQLAVAPISRSRSGRPRPLFSVTAIPASFAKTPAEAMAEQVETSALLERMQAHYDGPHTEQRRCLAALQFSMVRLHGQTRPLRQFDPTVDLRRSALAAEQQRQALQTNASNHFDDAAAAGAELVGGMEEE
jgi:hypothetical protein